MPEMLALLGLAAIYFAAWGFYWRSMAKRLLRERAQRRTVEQLRGWRVRSRNG